MSDATSPMRWPLSDDREAALRPITPDDFAIETAFLDSLSMETSYNRLFSTRHPSPEEIRRWTDIDASREVAFIVTTRDAAGAETMLAVGRAVHDDDGPDAEFALLVGDASKRLGLGRRLLEALIAAARARACARCTARRCRPTPRCWAWRTVSASTRGARSAIRS